MFFFLARFGTILDYGPECCHNCSSNNWRENSEVVGELKKAGSLCYFFPSFSLTPFINTFITSTLVITNDVDFNLLIDQIVNYCNEEMLKGIQPIMSFNKSLSPLTHISHLSNKGIGRDLSYPFQFNNIIISIVHLFHCKDSRGAILAFCVWSSSFPWYVLL